MTDPQQELRSKLKNLSLEDLYVYEDYAVTIKKLLMISGVGTLLLVLFNPGILVYLVAVPIVFVLAVMAGNTDISLKIIRDQILQKQNQKTS